MTGFLNDLNLQGVDEDPNYLPDGEHPAYISAIKINTPAPGAKDNHKALIITYKIDPDHPELHGRTKTEFKTLPNMTEKTNDLGVLERVPATEEDTKHAAYLKQRIKSLGVPESELGNV